ncbi:MAG TPA: cytochrome ubiquinol oxidase subunit I [Solirubrobacterales bacterium]|jgi:cytochrome d ubiquinol oxidase subunit I|nr:cytochrome ubiquinol oxidase subunit I [Solirubrobacterales bacterium]
MFPLDPLPLAASASNLLAAREQMAFTLGFHIVLASLGVALPATILLANYIGLKRGDEAALELARRWSKAMAVTFAVGAVTGTVLTFEFGLLWPYFEDRFGAAFGVAFAIEGIFFFLEAIFLAIYIYGWKRLSPWAHFWSGVPMFVTGIGGAFAVVAANSWMNQPQGFSLDAAGRVVDVEPVRVLINPATGYEVPHMILAAYMVVGFLVASIYAVGMLKGRRDRLHRLGLLIPLTIGLLATPVQLLVGDTAARSVADHQPAKFAGMECVQETGTHQTNYLGGICTADGVKGAIPIPDLDSFLVGFSADTKITGLNDIPDDERPPANTLLHLSFDTMVAIGTALLLLGLWLAWSWWKRRDIPRTPWFLRVVAASGAAAVLALWCGWIVTEVGRQPWIVQGYMRTSEAVTNADGIWFSFALVLLLYAAVGTIAILVLRGMSRRWRETGAETEQEPGPYSPRGARA